VRPLAIASGRCERPAVGVPQAAHRPAPVAGRTLIFTAGPLQPPALRAASTCGRHWRSLAAAAA